MALIEIEYGSLASSNTMNNNFSYLDSRINSCNEGMISIQNNVYSLNSTLSQSIESAKNELNNAVDGLQTQINTLETNTSISVLADSLAPDYSKPISISAGTIDYNGWLEIQVWNNATNGSAIVTINGNTIAKAIGGSNGGIPGYETNMVIVSKGDVVQGSGSGIYLTRYDFKGA